jgi:hypothetical protein
MKKKTKNAYVIYPTDFVGSTQNHKKIIGAPNLPIRTKMFPEKTSLVY